MAVSGILGGQPIVLDNAAEEATLLRIENILASQSGRGGGDSGAADMAAAQAAQQNARAQSDAANASNQAAAGAGMAASALIALGQSSRAINRSYLDFQRSMTTMSGSMARSDPYAMTQSLVSAAADGLASVTKKTLDVIPKFGEGLSALGGGIITTTAAFAGLAIGVLSKTTAAFNDAQKAGALLGGDLIAFRESANNSGLTLDQFTGVIGKAGASMAAFGGQTIKGATAFGNANRELISGFGKDLRRMGIDYEEMGVRTSEYMETLSLSGQAFGATAMNANEVAAGTARLAKQQKLLATMNGESIEAQKQRQKAQRTDAAFQASLQGMSAKQRTEMEALITQFPHLSQAIKETIVTGDAVSAEAIMAVQAAGKQGEIILGGVRNIAEGVAPEEQITGIFRQLEASSDIIARETASAAETVKLGILGVNNAFVNAYTEQFLPLQRTAVQAGNKVFTNVEEDMVSMEKSTSVATENMLKIAENMQTAQVQLSTAVTNILDSKFGDKVVELVSMPTKALAEVATFMNYATSDFKKTAEAQANTTPETKAPKTPDAASVTQPADTATGIGGTFMDETFGGDPDGSMATVKDQKVEVKVDNSDALPWYEKIYRAIVDQTDEVKKTREQQ